MLRKYRAKYAASRASSETSEQFARPTSKLGSDALKYKSIGRYTVESKELDEDFFPYDDMTLNITKTDADGFVAFFSISGIDGIMLLDTDEEELYFRWLGKRDEGEDTSASEDVGAVEDEMEEEFNDKEASVEMPENGNEESQETKVKIEDVQHPDDKGITPGSLPPLSLKRERSISLTPDGEANSKWSKLITTTTVNHDTLFLMWRGRAGGDREIQLDPGGDFIGHIRFLDSECSEYEGVFYDTWTILDITLKGKKVSQEPGSPGEKWAKLSPRVWEDEGGEM